MTYDNWSPHQGPHQTGFLLIHGGSTEDCGLMKVNDNYMWHDYPCHSGIAFFYPYICQFGKLLYIKTVSISIALVLTFDHWFTSFLLNFS